MCARSGLVHDTMHVRKIYLSDSHFGHISFCMLTLLLVGSIAVHVVLGNLSIPNRQLASLHPLFCVYAFHLAG